MRRVDHLFQLRQHVGKGLCRDQSADFQRQQREYLAVLHRDEAAAAFDQGIDRNRHIPVIRPDHAEVVAVVADAGSQRAVADAETVHKAQTGPRFAAVAGQHGQLQHIPAGVGVFDSVDQPQLHRQPAGQQDSLL